MLKNIELYIATDGSDDNPGTKEKTLRSLEGARDTIRGLKKSGASNGGFTVFLRGGIYYRENTFELTTEDSGMEETPIVYRAYGNEQVRLVGGREIKREWFQSVVDAEVIARLPEAARGKVFQVNLKAHEISDYGNFGLESGLELFCNGRRMQLARWPNEGWALSCRDELHQKTELTFTFESSGDPPNRWSNVEEVLLHGYWRYDYQDMVFKPESIDTEKREITLDSDVGTGPEDGRRFYALNLLEELDEPGEWYLDRKKGVLYFLPPEDFQEGLVLVSILEEPLVALRETSYVTMRGLTLEATRGTAVMVQGGTHNLVAGCIIRNIGTKGVILAGGKKNGVVGCDIYDLGSAAIEMSGGDRKTLTPAENYVVNNHIHHYARRGRSYRPAVRIDGVGNRVAHNLIHDAPHSAILYHGNDHVIEFNEFHDVVLETSDAGVLYSGYDWTFRGNVVRYNFFHHIPHILDGYTRVVYMDDAHCSTETFGNVFYKTHQSVWIGGGRDNIVENNIFIECEQPVNIDNRGLRWTFLNPDGNILDTGMYKKLTAVDYDKPPWSIRYPKLARILEEDPRAPLGNTLENNVSYRSGWQDPEKVCRATSERHIDKKYMKIADNFVTEEDPGFVDVTHMNFQLRDDSVVYQKIPGFKKIPFGEIGLYQDEYRVTWPVSKDQP